jgi:UDP-N-acetylmuramoyl-tripeptide--D-alanyl-D-alanine ligase
MIALQLAELAGLVQGRLAGADAAFLGISTDTRSLRPGELFFALHGPNFDGHDYLGQALAAGAAGAVVDREVDVAMPVIRVADTLAALGLAGRGWRQRAAARVIGLTGSNGKTTLKEMLAAILGVNGSVMATRGNLNNAIGVPLTLARIGDERFAVIEMGANHRGEIDYLTRLVLPDIAILNNAGRAHLEGFGGIEGVARGKGEIINGLDADGVFILNADDRFAPMWRELASAHRVRSFGVEQPADVSSPADDYRIEWGAGGFAIRFPVMCDAGSAEFTLRLAGRHNRMNALAAIAAALEAGVSLDEARRGLARVQPVAGRLCPLPAVGGATLIDDSYNANPDSVLGALQVLQAAPGRRTMVLGDLAELGDEAVGLHRQLGVAAGEAGIDRLMACGELSRHAAVAFPGEAHHFASRDDLIASLRDSLDADDTVLVKGSRSAGMDQVVSALRAGGSVC